MLLAAIVIMNIVGKQDSLNDRLSDNTCETCNTYNMLKLTRHLFAWQSFRRIDGLL